MDMVVTPALISLEPATIAICKYALRSFYYISSSNVQLVGKGISKFPKPLSLIVPKDHIYRWKFVGCAFNTGHNYCQV